jgi:hypothetical protein
MNRMAALHTTLQSVSRKRNKGGNSSAADEGESKKAQRKNASDSSSITTTDTTARKTDAIVSGDDSGGTVDASDTHGAALALQKALDGLAGSDLDLDSGEDGSDMSEDDEDDEDDEAALAPVVEPLKSEAEVEAEDSVEKGRHRVAAATALVEVRTTLFAAAANGGVGRAAFAKAVDRVCQAVARNDQPGWEGGIVRRAASNLQSLAKGASLRPLSAHSMVRAAIAIDTLYFQAYYAQVASRATAADVADVDNEDGGSAALPAPDEFFKTTLPPAAARRRLRAKFIAGVKAHSTEAAASFAQTWGMILENDKSGAAAGSWRKLRTPNPLLVLARLRFDEGLLLWWATGLDQRVPCDVADARQAAADESKFSTAAAGEARLDGFRSEGPRAAPRTATLLARWRDSARDWLAHLYAYAVPNDRALAVLAELGPLVDMGAGTGYWAHLLAQRGVDVRAYDVLPPTPAEKAIVEEERGGNAYHGYAPAFHPVQQGHSRMLGKEELSQRALLLCYPPPDSEMAQQCVYNYRGDTMVYVGEWQGATATAAFERALVRRFQLTRTVPLPCFDNQACAMTVWKRRPEVLDAEQVPRLQWLGPLAKAVGAGLTGGGLAADGVALGYRCRFCREVVLPARLATAAQLGTHRAIHALRHIVLKNEAVLQHPGATDAPSQAAWVPLDETELVDSGPTATLSSPLPAAHDTPSETTRGPTADGPKADGPTADGPTADGAPSKRAKRATPASSGEPMVIDEDIQALLAAPVVSGQLQPLSRPQPGPAGAKIRPGRINRSASRRERKKAAREAGEAIKAARKAGAAK